MPSALTTPITMRAPTVLKVDLFDKALQGDNADAVEHWGCNSRRAQRHRQETREQRRDREGDAESKKDARGQNTMRADVVKTAIVSAGSHMTGSRSADRLSATPPIAATGIHKKKRQAADAAQDSAPYQPLNHRNRCIWTHSRRSVCASYVRIGWRRQLTGCFGLNEIHWTQRLRAPGAIGVADHPAVAFRSGN